MTDFSEQEVINFNIAADCKVGLPEILRDVIRVVSWSVSQKTPGGECAAALARLQELAAKLEPYKRTPTTNEEYRR
jgi:hypothetical protein